MSRDGASSDGMGRRNGRDEGGDGKAGADVGAMVGLGQRLTRFRRAAIAYSYRNSLLNLFHFLLTILENNIKR